MTETQLLYIIAAAITVSIASFVSTFAVHQAVKRIYLRRTGPTFGAIILIALSFAVFWLLVAYKVFMFVA